MKVMIVNKSNTSGGAGRAAYRLHHALRCNGVNSCMLVGSKDGYEKEVFEVYNKKNKQLHLFRYVLDSIPVRLYKNNKALFSPSIIPAGKIVKKINESDVDIVHLHWICNGLISIEDIGKIQKPIVFSLHDMWLYTGGCHYDCGCGKYKSECGNCPVLGSNRKIDLSRIGFERKRKLFTKKNNIVVVGLSNWMSECARSSRILKDKQIITLPNPIDAGKYQLVDKKIARKLHGLPVTKKLVGCFASKDSRKGLEIVKKTLIELNDENIEVVVIGEAIKKNVDSMCSIYNMGVLKDDVSLRLFYNSLDVMMVPSIQENLSNVIMESLACGTPVVCFKVGGNVDLVNHKVNGYLANECSVKEMISGIRWLIKNNIKNKLGINARVKIEEQYDMNRVSRMYEEVYQNLLR